MVQSRSRRLGAALATLALAGIAACGDTEAKDGGDAGDAAAGYPLTVQHHKGETEIEDKPERVVALDPSLVEAVVALDVPLTGGIAGYEGGGEFPPYLGDSVEGAQDVGPLESPNLEEIAALEPDMIVSASVRHEDLYDELSQIAPTVFVETTGPTWKDNVTKVAEALGEQDKADEELSAYEERAAAIGEQINEAEGDPEISVTRFMDGPTRLMGNDSFTGIVLSDMGLARPKEQDVDDFAVEIGEEEIRKADGDHLFVTAYADGEQSQEKFQRNPLWRKLDAVEAGNVHEVDDDTWMLSVSLQGAHLMLDDMAEIFDVDPARE
jgi:iron complex transport system substrate-binding protein